MISKPLSRVASLFQAMLTGERVSDELFHERMAICKKCEYYRKDRFGHFFCGRCGCNVSYELVRILNLAAYKEKLPLWGCKHPRRRRGFGWKK